MKKTSVRINEPCNASWDEMHGDGEKRFCDHCTKDVHYLSAMTRQDARSLLRERADDGLCVRYAYDATGRLRFSNRRVQPSAPRHQRIGAAALLATASIASSMIAACDWSSEANGMVAEHKGDGDGDIETVLTGEPAPLEPAWMGVIAIDPNEGSGETDGSGDETEVPCDPDSPPPLEVVPQPEPRMGRFAPPPESNLLEEPQLEEMGDYDPEAVVELTDMGSDVEIETVTPQIPPRSHDVHMIAGGIRPVPPPGGVPGPVIVETPDVDPSAALEEQEDRAADQLAEFGISLDDEEIVDEEYDEGSGSVPLDTRPSESP